MGKPYFILVDSNLPSLVAKMCSSPDNSKCVGWQQTRDETTGRLRYEAVMVREVPEPYDQDPSLRELAKSQSEMEADARRRESEREPEDELLGDNELGDLIFP
jgi:hypothetical protein